ncbi:MAG: hypothetical protein JWP44_2415 [Mucilaginibacter sp.]|nr:hypothetical protein [Mucilaginibacter sp.]
MKKISLIATLFSAVLLLQNCKKTTVTAYTTSTEPMIAFINDTTWIAKAANVKATLTYNSAAKTKVFTCTGLSNNQQINLYATQHNVTNTTGFPLATYNVNSTTDVALSYYLMQNGSFKPQGTVAPGSGTITVTAIDSVKKIITGTFSFASLTNNYDNNGNIISTTVAQISAGGFNNVPYTFTSN